MSYISTKTENWQEVQCTLINYATKTTKKDFLNVLYLQDYIVCNT